MSASATVHVSECQPSAWISGCAEILLWAHTDSLVVEHPVVDAVGEELGQVRGRAGVLVQVDEQTRHFVELRPVVLQQRQLAVRLADLHEVGVAMVLEPRTALASVPGISACPIT
eukprot:2844992-Rhodomonas_salina.1